MSVTERSLPAIVANLLSGAKPPKGLGRGAEAYLATLKFRKNVTRISFIALVVVPTVIATLFYGLLAAPRYVSDVKFIVRSVSTQRATGLDMLFRTFGIAKTVDDANVIQKYLESRDAMQAIIASGIDLKAIFQRPEADWWSSYPYFWRRDTTESLYSYYTNHVVVAEDSTKGIIELQVITFRPADSLELAKTLLRLAEVMVNKMNERAQRDAMGAANREVNFAMETVIQAQSALTSFRNKEVMVDPSKSTFSLIETIGNLTTDLSYAIATLKEMQTSSPNNPGIPTQRAKIAALEDRVRVERSKLAGGDDSLASKIASYEQLALRRDLADKALAASMNALDTARQEARRQHIYVEQVVEPNLPDESMQPERLRSIISVMVFGFAAFAVIWIISVGSGEHAQ